MRAYLKSAMAHARIAVSRSIPHKTACAQPPTPIRPTSHGDDGDFLFVAPRGKIYVNVIAAAVAPPPPPTSSVNVCVMCVWLRFRFSSFSAALHTFGHVVDGARGCNRC